MKYAVVGSCEVNNKLCLNGGTCVNFKEDYLCICMRGYEGKSCEIGNLSVSQY